MKITASLFFVCFLGIALPNSGFACHKTDGLGDPIPHGRNGNCDPGGGDGGDGGNTVPTFNVTISGHVTGSGTDWPVENTGIDSISYFDGSQGQTGGDGFIDLGYFVVPSSRGGPFTGQRGANCFGTAFPILLKAGSLEQRNDLSGYAHFTVYGKTDDGLTEIQYHLDMTGPIAMPNDWTPGVANSMDLVTWKLLLGANKYKKYANKACLGESTAGDGFLTTIDVVRSN